MIYETLKNLVESLKTSYKCPDCNSWIEESNIDIVWAAWNTVNFDISCPRCWKHWIVKSQLMMVDIGPLKDMKGKMENLKDRFKSIKKFKNTISDSEIVDLDKNLKNKQMNASDLFQ